MKILYITIKSDKVWGLFGYTDECQHMMLQGQWIGTYHLPADFVIISYDLINSKIQIKYDKVIEIITCRIYQW